MTKRSLPASSIFGFGLLVIVGAVLFYLWHTGIFGRFDRFNVVVAATPVTLVSVNAKEKTATVVSFPDDLMIFEVVPNYGAYKISSVYRVGELDKRGGKVLSWTVGEFLGVPVDGYVAPGQVKLSDVKGFFLRPGTWLGKATDLNVLDRLRLALSLVMIRFDKITMVDLGKLAESLVLADGTTGIGVDRNRLDSFLTGDFVEPTIRAENLRVEVVNATKGGGLGARAARILTAIGVSVVNVKTSDEWRPSCEIWVQKNLGSTVTVRRIAQVFSCKVGAGSATDRADVSVVLGEDYAGRFNK